VPISRGTDGSVPLTLGIHANVGGLAMATLAQRYRAGLGDRIAFSIIWPWAIIHGKAEPLLERLRVHGFRVVAYDYRTLGDDELEYLAGETRDRFTDKCWRLLCRACGMGVSCGLLLFFDKPTGSASRTLKSVKGETNPSATRPGELRYDFRAPNRMLNLVHSADDWDSALRECTVFFPPGQLMHLFGELEEGRHSFAHEPALLLDPRFASINKRQERAATALLLEMRQKIVRLVQDAAPGMNGAALSDYWAGKLKKNYLAESVAREAQEYLTIIVEEKPLLDAVLAQRELEALSRDAAGRSRLHALSVLNDVEQYANVDCGAIARSAGGLPDERDDLLFRTTLACFDQLRQGIA
jgi:nucleoside diphosphate kinase